MSNEMRALANEPPALEFDFSATTRTVARLLCLLMGLGVAGLGVYFGWRVFGHVESVITDGKPLESAVDAVAKVIHAEDMKIQNPNNGVDAGIGRTIAVGLVWMFYMPAMWISLGFIKAGASLIAASIAETTRR